MFVAALFALIRTNEGQDSGRRERTTGDIIVITAAVMDNRHPLGYLRHMLLLSVAVTILTGCGGGASGGGGDAPPDPAGPCESQWGDFDWDGNSWC